MAIKDSVAVLDANSGMIRPVRRGDAIGAEIPVTVHASRTAQNLGQNLPPVHEETRTVIVLPQGAVVRLTASLTSGETVVLTNHVTGADVLCRVTNVKSQAGIQHYVDLEFTQRAPGFWGESDPAQGTAVLETPAAAPIPSVLPAAVTAPPDPSVLERPVAAKPAPIATLPSSTQPLKPAPLAELVSAPKPVRQPETLRPVRPPSSSRGSTDVSSRPSTSPLLAALPLDTEITPRASSGSMKIIVATAASVLLVVGAAAVGGYWFYLRPAMLSDVPAPREVVSVPQSLAPPLVPTAAYFPVDNPAATDPSTAPLPEAQAQVDLFIEPRAPVERPVNPVQAAPVAARGPQPAARRNNLAIGKLQAPVRKATPSTARSTLAPPVLAGTMNALVDTGTGNTLLAGPGTDAAPPPPSSRPTSGSQLQLPKLVSSTPPAYPVTARLQRVQGVVVLDALVDPTGRVVEATVISGPLSLQAAAREAVRSWRYEPARLNGEPIPVHARVNVQFNLN